MTVQHFLLTRFNVRLKGFLKDAAWKGGDSDYLERRFSLFEKYTLASVKRQHTPFKWLVFFSSQTPEPFKSRARSYTAQCPQYEAVFVDDAIPLDGDKNSMVLASAIFERLDPQADYYIASRIDNDDAFNVNALKAVREETEKELAATRRERFYVVLPYGTVYVENGGYTQDYAWDWNHFPSVVCCREVVDQPFSTPHSKIPETGLPVIRVPLENAWLEVVNGTNLVNSLKVCRCHTRYFSTSRMHALFGINVKMSWWRFLGFWLSTYFPAKLRAVRLFGKKAKG